MKKSLGILILVLISILAAAHFIFKQIPKPNFANRGEPVICDTVPEFSNYPTVSGSGAVTVPINFSSNSRAEALKTEILAATPSGINFAQKYMLVEGECGYACQNHAIVDATSGDITEYGLRTTGGVSFQPDSSLLIVNPNHTNITRYYNFKDGSLEILCEK